MQHTAKQQTAAHCYTLQDTTLNVHEKLQDIDAHYTITKGRKQALQHTATHHIVTHCNTLQHTATHCNTLQHAATRCNTLQLQHTATHCNSLQHISLNVRKESQEIDEHCIIAKDIKHALRYTAIHCNTLQHTAAHCNIYRSTCARNRKKSMNIVS